MRKLSLLALTVILFLSSGILRGQVYEWRGPDRNGIIPETGLMKSWPEKGPVMIWSYQGLGDGHTSIGPGKDRFFITGLDNATGNLFAFDYNGKLLWKKSYGPEWNENYVGPRSTPVVINDLVYFQSGYGVIYCYNANNGEMVWSVDLQKKFDGRKVQWGMVENMLIKGDRIFCTPGGIKNNLAALNRYTGETIWTSPGNKEPSAYCSSLYVKHNNAELIVTATDRSVIGVDARTGDFYWHVPQYQTYRIHANVPVYSDGVIYCASEDDVVNNGLVALKLSPDGKKVTTLWRNREFKNVMGGFILRDGLIFGSVYESNKWCCIDITNGKIIHSFNNFGDGSILLADGLFYCYSMRGEMALMSADLNSYKMISRFKIPMGEGPHFSHPVIYKGRLYVRHGNALMVYEIKA
jgi:outer membrane protein assembly factor BamB